MKKNYFLPETCALCLVPCTLCLSFCAFSQNIGIGTTTPAFKLDVKGGSINTDSLYRIGGNSVLSINLQNTFLGIGSGNSFTTGNHNTSIGNQALHFNTLGIFNTATGDSTLYSNTSGTYNIAYGSGALYSNTNGNYNTANGAQSLYSNNTGTMNTALGFQAGALNSIGNGNIFLGFQAGFQETGSNKLYIHNSMANASNALIYGDFDDKLLRSNGRMEIFSDNTLNDGLRVIKNYAVGTLQDRVAIFGQNTVDDPYGIGVKGVGGSIGVDGLNSQTGPNTHIGVRGTSSGLAFDATNKGMEATASGSHFFNIGLHATATGNPSAQDNYGVKADVSGGGGHNIGILVNATGANFQNFGVKAVATASDAAGFTYGVFGSATGDFGINYGVYGTTSGIGTNFAAFFHGRTMIDGTLGVRTNSTHELAIKQSNSTNVSGIKLELNTNNNNWVTYIDNANDYNFAYNGVLAARIQDVSGTYVAVSDERLKKDIEPLPGVLKNLLALNPTSYRFINSKDENGKRSNGFLAQEVLALFPDVVMEKDGIYGIAYDALIPIAIKAIQEQQTIIETQDKRIARLETQIKLLLEKK